MAKAERMIWKKLSKKTMSDRPRGYESCEKYLLLFVFQPSRFYSWQKRRSGCQRSDERKKCCVAHRNLVKNNEKNSLTNEKNYL